MNDESLDGLSIPELIERMAEIPEPTPVSFLPETAAWAWLGVALGLVLVPLAMRVVRRRKASVYRRAALRELDRVGGSPADVARLLRHTALVAYPRREVAGLVGDDWLRFLEATAPRTHFLSEVGRSLGAAPYARRVEADSQQIAELARDWIRFHRVERPEGAG